MTTPSEQKLSLYVSKESLTFQYLTPEAGAYLGAMIGPAISFKAPLRLTGIAEDYSVPAPPELFFGSKGPHFVVRFTKDGYYTVENPPTFNVALSMGVPPGFYLGKATGTALQFDAPPLGRRDTWTHHTLIPGGEAVKGVDVPILVEVVAPALDARRQAPTLPTSSSELFDLMRIAEGLGKIYKEFTHVGPRTLCQKMLASKLSQFMMHEEAKSRGLEYRVTCDDSVNPPDYEGLTKARVEIKFGSSPAYYPVMLDPGVLLTEAPVPVSTA